MSKLLILVLFVFIVFQEYLIWNYSQINEKLQNNIMDLITACLAANV